MKRKLVQTMVGLTFAVSAIMLPVMASSAAEAETEIVTETETEAETNTEDAAEEDGEVKTLKDYEYEAGTLTEDGWKNTVIKMSYEPTEAAVTMGVAQNDKMNEYYARNGEDEMIARNEMIALDEGGSYIQLIVEVNPNGEKEEDVIKKFTENEGMEIASETKELEIGGRTFTACTGLYNKEKYMLAVDTDDEIAVAIKCKYTDTTVRKALLEGFKEIEEEESETETEAFESVTVAVASEFETETEGGVVTAEVVVSE